VKKGSIVCRKLRLGDHRKPRIKKGGVAKKGSTKMQRLTSPRDAKTRGGRVVTKCMLDDVGGERESNFISFVELQLE
jgi:hypothetical protein